MDYRETRLKSNIKYDIIRVDKCKRTAKHVLQNAQFKDCLCESSNSTVSDHGKIRATPHKCQKPHYTVGAK